jgi:hypothetical protein
MKPGPTTKDGRRRAKEKAFAAHKERVLANPDAFSRLAIARYEQNLTQRELAALPSVRLDLSTISKLERNIRAGNKNTRGRISYPIGIPEQELFPE